jgi:hypothetical protein
MPAVRAPNIDFSAANPPNNAAQPINPVAGIVIVPAIGAGTPPVAAPIMGGGGGGGGSDATWSYPIGA